MKAWTSATIDGRCASNHTHTWKAGTRVYRIQGHGWKKDFCTQCATALYDAPADTGEVLDLTDAPTYPKPLKALVDAAGERFDAKLAQAGKDD